MASCALGTPPLFRNAFGSAPRAPVLLAVDVSYACFHRYFAMRSWAARRAAPDGDSPSDPDLAAFGDSFRQCLLTQARRYGAAHTVLMLDCARADIWRRDVLPEYKATRPALRSFSADVFPYLYGTVLPALAAELGYRSVACPRAEADDVAHVLADWAVARGMDVVLLTGDADLAQLCRPGVRAVDMRGDCVLAKACRAAGCERDAARYLALKLLVGDKGDNVPPVRPRMGPKTALKCVDDLAAVLADPDTSARYERNRTLVDLSRMPRDVHDGVLAAVRAAFP